MSERKLPNDSFRESYCNLSPCLPTQRRATTRQKEPAASSRRDAVPQENNSRPHLKRKKKTSLPPRRRRRRRRRQPRKMQHQRCPNWSSKDNSSKGASRQQHTPVKYSGECTRKNSENLVCWSLFFPPRESSVPREARSYNPFFQARWGLDCSNRCAQHRHGGRE